MKLKVQTEVITIVLISGIVIALVGAAYMWGAPLISKRTAITDFLSAEDFVVKLNDKIVEIANSGSGVAAFSVPKGLVRVVQGYNSDGSPFIDDDNNSIILEVLVKQPLAMGNTVVLKTNVLGEYAAYGEAEPRIITMTSQPYSPDYRLKFKLHYRELDTKNPPYNGYKIAIENGTVTGSNQIVVSYIGSVKSGTTANGGDLFLTRIRVDVF